MAFTKQELNDLRDTIIEQVNRPMVRRHTLKARTACAITYNRLRKLGFEGYGITVSSRASWQDWHRFAVYKASGECITRGYVNLRTLIVMAGLSSPQIRVCLSGGSRVYALAAHARSLQTTPRKLAISIIDAWLTDNNSKIQFP